jgi:hypothetical protein
MHPLKSVGKNLGMLSDAFYVMTNVFLVFLLCDTLKMVTRVTETCRCDKENCTAEHLGNCTFVGFYKKFSLTVCISIARR